MSTKSAKQKSKKAHPTAAKTGMKPAKPGAVIRYGHKRKAAEMTAKTAAKKSVSKAKMAFPRPPAHAVLGTPLPTTVPTQEEIAAQASALTGPAAAAFGSIMTGLAEHLGSPEAARLWLVTPSTQFDTTPLDAILAGEAEIVLAYLESRWGPGPVYA